MLWIEVKVTLHPEDFFSDNYHIIDGFDNPMCAIISRTVYVQRDEPGSSGCDPG